MTRRSLTFAPLWCSALIACGASPGDSDLQVSSTEQAATFPATDAGWFPLRQKGFGIGDVPTDANGDHREIIGDATHPAMFYYVDDTHFFVRMRLQGDPNGPGILKSFGWGLVFDTDSDPNDWEYGVIVDGVGEVISFVQNTVQATLGDPSDKAEVTLSSEPTSIAPGGNLQITSISPPLVVSGNDTQDWFLDFAIPLHATAPAKGLYDVLTPDQTLQVIGGTSNNAASLDLDLAGCDTATSIACALSDEIEVDPDLDNDGVPNFRDLDDDNDGLPDTLENDLGLDPDGDHDGDGKLNWRDVADRGDGQPNICPDATANGVCDVAPVLFDDDGDGRPNHRDLDADNDAIADSVEAGHRGPDLTFRGMVDGAVGANGLPDAVETTPDSGVINYPVLRSDFEGAPDVRDLDSDGDGVFDVAEVGAQAFDTNSDGRVELQPTDDFDGIQTAVDRDPAKFGYPGIQPRSFDADGDGIPDPFDRVGGTSGGDGDGDGVTDSAECVGGWVCPDGDADGYPDYIESSDQDGDGVADGEDDAPTDPLDCRDQDGDGCDDCSVTGANGSGGSVTNDGTDTDADGACDLDDPDNDSDGILDTVDPAPTDPDVCGDSDGDTCDDCAVGTDDLGPLSDSQPSNDGVDTDGDGQCDQGEAPDTDGDGVVDPADADPADPHVCRNLDGDSCDDCAVTGADGSGGDVANDGPDADGDGQCDTAPAPDLDGDGVPDATDLDDDNDGILDAEELSGVADVDADGITNDRDLDSDGDGISDVEESGGAGTDANGDGRVDGAAGANGIPDAAETSPESGMVTAPVDSDDDGTADYRDRDSDGDTISDADEAGDADLGTPPVDTDDDGLPDYLDLDSDSDHISDANEAGDDELVTPPVDTDGDGTPDFRDLDSDNDGKPDVDEGGGPGNDNGPQPDFDDDGTPDFQDPDRYGLQGGGCAAGGDAGAGAGGLVLLGALGAVLTRRRRRALAAVALAPAALGVSTAAAQSADLASAYPVERARFNANSDGVLDVDWGGVLPHLTIDGGFFISLANDPLTVYRGTDAGRERVASLVSQRIGGEMAAAIGLFDRLELGVSIPLILSQSQDAGSLMAGSVDSFGLGDLRLFGKVAVLEQDTHLVNGAVFVRVALPSSTSGDYFGDSSGVIEPGIAVSRAFGRSLRATTTLLYRLRDRQEALDLVVDDEIAFDAGVGYRFAGAPVELSAAFGLATSASDGTAFNTTYSEGKLGAQYDIPGPLAVFAGAGAGLAEGWGSPDWRVLAGVRFVGERPGEPEPPVVAPPVHTPPVDEDPDIDGMLGAADACPSEPETINGYQDEDGCPDVPPDTDGDGLADAADRCPGEAEDKDGFQDDDGCLDADNDADGVPDASDRCPLEVGVAAMAGCPDPDGDGDGVVDRLDNCPTEAGTTAQQGCAAPQLVQIVDGKLALIEPVYFKTDRAVIEKKSNKLLTNVAAVLAAHPALRVRVEGHTDNQGKPAHNQGLSQRRAEAVVAFLVKAGIDQGRLEAKGYGDTQPVADNKTKMGRATNRRVVFTMLEGGAGVSTQSSGPGADTVGR